METNSCNDKLTQRNSLLQPVNSLAGVKYGGKMLQIAIIQKVQQKLVSQENFTWSRNNRAKCAKVGTSNKKTNTLNQWKSKTNGWKTNASTNEWKGSLNQWKSIGPYEKRLKYSVNQQIKPNPLKWVALVLGQFLFSFNKFLSLESSSYKRIACKITRGLTI